MPTVYLAGPYASRERLLDHSAELVRIGYKVSARWLDGSHGTPDGVEPTIEQQADWAQMDLDDIRKSDLLIAFTAAAAGVPTQGVSGGRHVETGYALGQHKTVLLVGEPENVFHWLRVVTILPNWHEALIELSARLVQHERGTPRAVEDVAS